MSRITRAIAEDVAKKLLNSKQSLLNESIKEHSDVIRNKYMAALPNDIVEFFNKHKDYCLTERLLKCKESNAYIKAQKDFPVNGYSGYPIISQTKDELEWMRKNEKEESNINKLRRSVTEALYNLKTYKRIESEFPEAVQYLPKTSVNTALAISLSEIRSKIA